MNNKNIKVLTIGTGAVGAFYSYKFHLAGYGVSVLCRSDYNYVKKNGFRIKSGSELFHFKPDLVLRDLSEFHDKPDYVIISTKSLPEINTADLIKDVINSDTKIILLQNGIFIEEELCRMFPENEIFGGVVYICSRRIEYGYIEHQCGGKLVIGKYPSGESKSLKKIIKDLNKTGIPVIESSNIMKDRWEKLMWNASFNPISVLSGSINTRTILNNYETRELVRNIMSEVVKLSEINNNSVDKVLIEKMIRDTEKLIPYKPSMLLDFENKRPIEIESILGNALLYAKKNETEVPYIKTIYSLLSVLQRENLK